MKDVVILNDLLQTETDEDQGWSQEDKVGGHYQQWTGEWMVALGGQQQVSYKK